MKLTKPQRKLLADLYRCDREMLRKHVAIDYPPAVCLVNYGLAQWRHSRISTWLIITPTGIAEHERKPS